MMIDPSGDPLVEQFTANFDSGTEEYESDDDIVYFSSSCTLEIKGDTDESEDEDEPENDEDSDEPEDDEDSDDDENVKDEVLSHGNVDDPEFDCCVPLKEEKPSQGNGTDPDFDYCRPSKQEKPSQEAVDKLEEIRSFMPGTVNFDEMYYIDIYGYIRGGYGGYGIVILNSSKQPIDAYCRASKGGSYMYHLMKGMKRGLQIASKRGFPRVTWEINSYRAKEYYNNIFGNYCMLKHVFHSHYDAAHAHICWKCLRRRMGLTGAVLEELVPVIKDIIQLQYDTKFKYRQDYGRLSIFAAYYAAQCGEQALLRLEAEKVEMKMLHPQNLTPILKREKTSLGCQSWYVLQRRPS